MESSTLIIIACVITFVVIPSFKDRTMSVKKLLIGPTIFLYLFYRSLGVDFPIFPVSHVVIVIGGMLGMIMGYTLRKSAVVIAHPAEKAISLKGGIFTLCSFIVIFAVHFVVGYLKSVNPDFFTHVSVENQLLLMMLALVSCLTAGSNSCLFVKYLFQGKYKGTQMKYS